MGKRGPKAKPTPLRILEGNPGRRPMNEAEPIATGAPACPDHLSEDGKAIWREIMGSVPPGMYSAADGPLLAAFCEAWATHKAATEAMAKNRDLLGNNLLRGDKPSPYLRIINEAARTMASLATRLGLSPADRSGLKLGDPGKRSSKWSDLIAS